jgi:hypothetical protein
MTWQWTPYTIPIFLSVIVSAALEFLAWRHRPSAGAVPAAILMLGVRALGYALQLMSTTLPAKLFWIKVAHLGMAVIPPAWLALALQYVGQDRWLTWRNLALLSLVPFVTLPLACTVEYQVLEGTE